MSASTNPVNASSCAEIEGIGQRYVRAALYSGLLGGVSHALYGLTPLVVARRLGPQDYGVYAVVMSLVTIVIGVFNLGQNSVLHKLIPQYYVQDRARGGSILANVLILTASLLAIFCVAFFCLSGWVATRLYHDAGLTDVFKLSAPLMFTLALSGLAASVIAGLQDFKSYNQIQVARNLAFLILVWLGVLLLNLRGALWGQLLAGLFGLGLLSFRGLRLVRERFPEGLRLTFTRRDFGVIASFALPALALTLLNLPAYWWTNTLVAQHAGFEEAGMFSAAFMLAQLIFLIPMSLYTPAMTFMSEAYATSQTGSQAFTSLVSANLRAIWLFTLPLALGCALLAPVLIKTLFGPAYLGATSPTFALSFAAVLMMLIGLINTAITAAGRVWSNCVIALGWTALFAIGGPIFIPRWGAMGAAMLFAISYILYLCGVVLYSHIALHVRYARLGRLVTLTTVSFALAAIIVHSNMGAAAAAGAGAALWLGLIAAEWLWICDGAERKQFRQSAASLVRYRKR